MSFFQISFMVGSFPLALWMRDLVSSCGTLHICK
jgi:hypothetical protein